MRKISACFCASIKVSLAVCTTSAGALSTNLELLNLALKDWASASAFCKLFSSFARTTSISTTPFKGITICTVPTTPAMEFSFSWGAVGGNSGSVGVSLGGKYFANNSSLASPLSKITESKPTNIT